MGEGAGVLILEREEHAAARGASVYGRIVGYGASSDAFDMVQPDEDGAGALIAMRAALRGRRREGGRCRLHLRPRHRYTDQRPCRVDRDPSAVRRPTRRPSPRPSRRSAICSARPGRPRRWSASRRFGETCCHRRSTTRWPIRSAISTISSKARARRRGSSSRCRTRSASAARTPVWQSPGHRLLRSSRRRLRRSPHRPAARATTPRPRSSTPRAPRSPRRPTSASRSTQSPAARSSAGLPSTSTSPTSARSSTA